MNSAPWLSLLTVTPLLGGLLLLALGKERQLQGRPLALAVQGLVALQVLLIWSLFDSQTGLFQFVERYPWIPALGVDYYLAIDGLGLVMLLLTALVMPMAICLGDPPRNHGNLYFALLLFLQSGLIGTFTALNFFHWFLFWELSLIPAFFLVRNWGGWQSSAAATQFFVYTLVGSVGLLLGFVALYQATGTFDFVVLAERASAGDLFHAVADRLGWVSWSNESLALLLFCLVLLGLVIKVPMIPFHTWLPATYVEAPTPVTLVLTALMSKMGLYGLLRIVLPIFPDQVRQLGGVLLTLAVVTVIAGAAAALAQKDLKRILAYSSINHLGYCLVAIFAVCGSGTGDRVGLEQTAALNGVILQIFNHGITAAALFAFVAFIERRSGGLRGIDDFGGLRRVAPVFTGLMGIALFSSLGLPGLNGFVGEFLIFKGVFGLAPVAIACAVVGLLLTAVFILNILQKVFSGPLNPRWSQFGDLTVGEKWAVVPAVVVMFAVGLYPQWLVGIFNSTVMRWVEDLPL